VGIPRSTSVVDEKFPSYNDWIQSKKEKKECSEYNRKYVDYNLNIYGKFDRNIETPGTLILEN